jgi:hypothetical protein
VSLSVVLPLVLLVLVVFVLVVFVRRAAAALARAREAVAFARETDALSRRMASVVDPLLERLDAVRRHQVPADEVRAELAAAHGEFVASREAIERWRTPGGFVAAREAIAGDLDRLARSLEMIDFGTDLAGTGDGRQRELEAQTAIKRGYLNLLHARQAFADHAAAVPGLAAAAVKGSRASRT